MAEEVRPELKLQANACTRANHQEVFIGAYDDTKPPEELWQWWHYLTVGQAERLRDEINRALRNHSAMADRG